MNVCRAKHCSVFRCGAGAGIEGLDECCAAEDATGPLNSLLSEGGIDAFNMKTTTLEPGGGGGTQAKEIRKEHERFQKIGVSMDAVKRMKSSEVAPCVAACVVNYEDELAGPCKKYKFVLVKQFAWACIFGETFSEADDKYTEKMFDLVVVALAEVTEERFQR